jgi:hypothetical protein
MGLKPWAEPCSHLRGINQPGADRTQAGSYAKLFSGLSSDLSEPSLGTYPCTSIKADRKWTKVPFGSHSLGVRFGPIGEILGVSSDALDQFACRGIVQFDVRRAVGSGCCNSGQEEKLENKAHDHLS